MYLKSLEMQGFKSFPDKIELKFDKGITAVVGPNGSGKSNIGDAMRWVMGEQSSKQLRGEKMQGVIFHGTLTRPKAAFAQVTITIDNSDHRLGDEDETVSVSRKLYRNGDSEYMINSKQVRLKDVVELFMDTGLGRDGYSIIGQGRIADIVNEKSNERREIFEEAAGISKFRYKKEEAERKLLQAQDNISRLGDILGELASRIEPLRHQSEKAKKFIVLDEQKRKLEVSLWVKRLDEYFEKGRQLEEKLAAINEQYSALSEELTGNCRAQDYGCSPVVRMTNTYMAAGPDSFEDIIADTKDGIYVYMVDNGTGSSTFVMNASVCYRIRDGKICEPVRVRMLTGSVFQTLFDIDKVGTDFTLFDTYTCGKFGQSVRVSAGGPSIRVRKLSVS